MSASRSRGKDRQLIPRGKVVETAKNAARERDRVKDLRNGFASLQSLIPNVPPDTKLSKLDILILATNYIKYLGEILDPNSSLDAEDHLDQEQVQRVSKGRESGVDKYLHPVKKWPMRARLYAEKEGVPASPGTSAAAEQLPGNASSKNDDASCVSPASTASLVSSSPPCTSTNEWESIFDATDLDNGCFLLQLDAASLFDFNECAM